MKYLLFIIVFTITTVSCFAQTKRFELEIDLGKNFIDSIKINYSETNDDSKIFKQKLNPKIYYFTGEFLNNYLLVNVKVFLQNDSYYLHFLLDTGYQILKILAIDEKKKTAHIELFNMPEMEAQAYYLKHLYFDDNLLNEKRNLILSAVYYKKNIKTIDSLKTEYNLKKDLTLAKRKDFYLKFQNSYIVGYQFFQDIFFEERSYQDEVYDSMVSKKNLYLKSDLGSIHSNEFYTKRKFDIGKYFEDLKYYDVNYNLKSILNSTPQQYTLVHLWATWCKPCIMEIPKLDSVFIKHQNKLNMLSISLDSDETKWKKYLKDNLPKGIHTIFNDRYIHKDYLKDLRYTFIPQYILLDKNLKIVCRGEISLLTSTKGRVEILDEFLNTH